MTLLPKVKLKMMPSFSANIIGGTGIEVTKQNGHAVIDMSWNEFGTQGSIPTSLTNNVLTFDTATEAYVMIPSQLLGGAVAGITEAPDDGIQYGRQSEAWTPVTASAFLQAGTGAVTRTSQDKARDVISVRDFGAVGDGIANDTVKIQAAETYRASVGGTLYFPAGTYLVGAVNINRVNGGAWVGSGATLIAIANTMAFANLTGAATGATAKTFTIDGLSFHGNSKTGVVVVLEEAPYLTTLSHLTITNVQYCCVFRRGRGVTISNIHQYGSGTWFFTGVGNGPAGDRIFDVNIANVNHQSLGGASWGSSPRWFQFYRAVGVNMTNVLTASLDGGAIAFEATGACEGIFLTNCIFVYMTTGMLLSVGPDGVKPAWIYLSNVGLDQPTVSGLDANVEWLKASNLNVTFGTMRTNSGDGIRIRNLCSDVQFVGLEVDTMYRSGVVVEAGAVRVSVTNATILGNNGVGGAFYDIDLGACTFRDVVFSGKNAISTVLATGQRIVNGVTSKEVYRDTGTAGTLANTTPTTLMSYTLPAATAKFGQKIRVRAYGSFAATLNVKTIELAFGGSQVAVHSGGFNGLGWTINADVMITGAAAQDYAGNAIVFGQVPTANAGASAIPTEAGAVLIQMRATNGAAVANDIVCHGFAVEVLD